MSRVWLWILFTNSCNQGFIPVRGYCSCVIGMSEYRTKPRCNRWGLLRSLRTRTRISSGPQAKVKVKCTGYCHIAEGGYQCPLIYKIWHKTKLLGDLLKACLDNIVQVITTRFFNNSWNEVPLFLKRHPVVWILVAERFLMQTIFLSHLTFDFRGYPRELVFHGRTSLRNVINHGLCKCSFKERPVIFWSKEVLCRIGHGLL